MELRVYPACIECGFIELEKQVVTEGNCSWDAKMKQIIQCVHAPVCFKVQGQQMIEGKEGETDDNR